MRKLATWCTNQQIEMKLSSMVLFSCCKNSPLWFNSREVAKFKCFPEHLGPHKVIAGHKRTLVFCIVFCHLCDLYKIPAGFRFLEGKFSNLSNNTHRVQVSGSRANSFFVFGEYTTVSFGNLGLMSCTYKTEI